jgi:nucleoside phosphorylase
MKKILILITMKEEARGLLSSFDFTPKNLLNTPLPHHSYIANYQGHEIYLVTGSEYPDLPGVSVVGTDIAGILAHEALRSLAPDFVINAGTAGGRFQEGSQIGDVFLASSVAFHDRLLSLPNYQVKSTSYQKTPETFLEMAQKLSIKTGAVSTGNSFDLLESDNKKMMELGTKAKEMEAAAIAWVCDFFKIPFICLKAITDHIDKEHGGEQFFQNFDLACKNLTKDLSAVVKFILK